MVFNPNPANEVELIQVVGTWAKYNFGPRRAPHYGIIEEVGEAAHCVLKRVQGIRGFDDNQFFLNEFTDSLADTIIFLADWCYSHNAFFNFGRNMHTHQPLTTEDQPRILSHILQACSIMLLHVDRQMETQAEAASRFRVVDESEYNMLSQRICTGVEMWAQVYAIDLRLAVASTWAKVSQRDWIKNPVKPLDDLK